MEYIDALRSRVFCASDEVALCYSVAEVLEVLIAESLHNSDLWSKYWLDQALMFFEGATGIGSRGSVRWAHACLAAVELAHTPIKSRAAFMGRELEALSAMDLHRRLMLALAALRIRERQPLARS